MALEFLHKISNNLVLRKFLLKIRYPAGIGLVVLLLRYMHAEYLFCAFLVSMFGEAIQLWAFASLNKNAELAAKGPYVMVRNPMYLGRYFLVFGLLMLFKSFYVLPVYTVFYYFYMVNRVKREEAKLTPLLGEPYAKFCADVNRLLPDLRKIFKPEVRFFSFKLLVQNNGHWNLLSLLAVYAVILGYVEFYL